MSFRINAEVKRIYSLVVVRSIILALGAICFMTSSATPPPPTTDIDINPTPQPQVVYWPQISNVTYGIGSFALTATAETPVLYATQTASVCTTSGSTVTILAGGTCTIHAYAPSGYTTVAYAQSPTVSNTFTVLPAVQSVTSFPAAPAQVWGNAAFALSASTSSGNAAIFSSATPAVCSVSGSSVTMIESGTCTLAANVLATIDYTAATQVTQNVVIAPKPQTITIATVPAKVYGNPAFSISATASSGLAVTNFSSLTTAVCSVSGSTVTLATKGTCTVAANVNGNAYYAVAPQAQESINVAGQAQSITFGALSNVNYGSGSLTVSATASSALTPTYTSTTPATCSVAANTNSVTLAGGGLCTIAVNQIGNPYYAAAAQVTQSFTINPIAQSISFTAPASVPLGSAAFVPFTASSGLAVTLTSSNLSVCSVSGNIVSLINVGTCSLTASQSGNNDYLVATPLTQSFIVSDVSTVAESDGVTPPYLTNADAGTLPGSLSVGNNGAATYSIPIAVPPGTNGVQPSVALNYSSLGGNGLPGYGWSLSTGSSIHRCVKTAAQDGSAGPLILSASDALCLDGKRLVLVSGTYGVPGSVYRTEIDNLARISMQTVNGLTAFVVETKDGKTMTYGSSADSAVAAVGVLDVNNNPVSPSSLPPLFWDLTSVTDNTVNATTRTANNQILYHYAQNATTGEHLMTSIQYGNANGVYNTIVFNYACRNGAAETAGTPYVPSACVSTSVIPVGDADIDYVAGARADMRHRFTSIVTYTDGSASALGTMVQTITLNYVTSAVSQRSLLWSVQACSSSACLPATSFTWGTIAAANGSYPATSFVSQGLMSSGAPPVNGAEFNSNTNTIPGLILDYVTNPTGIDFQKQLGTLIVGDFVGDGKQRILTADQGEGGAGPAGLHLYTVNANGQGFTRTDIPYTFNPFQASHALPSQLDFGVPNLVQVNGATVNQAKYLQPNIIVGDFDGDGAMDFAFFDAEGGPNPTLTQYTSTTGGFTICLSRMATQGSFDCQVMPSGGSFTLNSAQQAAVQAAYTYYVNIEQSPPSTVAEGNGIFLNTLGNGRSDLLLYSTADPSSQTDTRCSYVAPTNVSTDNWTWTCGNYPGVYAATNASKNMQPLAEPAYAFTGANAFWPVQVNPGVPVKRANQSPIDQNMVAGARAPGSNTGDFWGSRQTGFIAPNVSYVNLSGNGPVLNVTMPNYTSVISTTAASTEFSMAVGAPVLIPGSSPATYENPSNNLFAWSTSPSSVSQVVSRYYISESRGVELTGSSIGDINGDGYADYLMTFEGHAEICYSNGSNGFNCRLMEDQTTAGWSPTALTFPSSANTTSITTVPHGITIPLVNGLVPTPAAGGFGVFSVLTVGHVNDTNLQEVIYRRGDGGAYSGGAGGPGGDQYYVCTVRDGSKNCTPWTGPNMRPYASGDYVDGVSFPIPGITYLSNSSTINWPTAGTIIGDFTGQGKTQVLWYCNASCSGDSNSSTGIVGAPGWQLFSPNTTGTVDRLMTVVNGVGNTTSVSYLPMSNPTVYTPVATDLITGNPIVPSYPLAPVVDNGRLLVNSATFDEGNGHTLTKTYQYQGLAADNTGRGELGFAVVKITTPTNTGTSLTSATEYAQGFPYTGMAIAYTMTNSSGVVLEQSQDVLIGKETSLATNTVTNLPTFSVGQASISVPVGGTSYCLYTLTSTQWQHRDLPNTTFPSGALLPLINNAASGADNYCNLTHTTSTVQAPASGPTYTTTTANTIVNQASPVWVVGEVTNSVVTKTETARNTAITRTKARTYYNNGTLQSETTEPGNAVLSVKTFFDRNPTSTCSGATGNPSGLINCVQQLWTDPVSGTAMTRNIHLATYDSQGRFPATATNAVGQSESYTYADATGAKLSKTDINGLITSWTADGFGRVLSETRPDHTKSNFYVKQCSSCASLPGGSPVVVKIVDHVTDASLGGVRISVPELDYADQAGHHLRHQSYGFLGQEIDTDNTYDSFGRIVNSYQPNYSGQAVHYATVIDSYDDLNRTTQSHSFNETGTEEISKTSYNGLSIVYTNPLSQTKTEVRDALGQISQTIDAGGNNSWFYRDAYSDLVQTKDSLGNLVTITYDNLGRKTAMQDPDLGLLNYGIDPRGIQYSQQSPNESTASHTTFVHDAMDRMTQRNEPDLTSNWVYDVNTGSAASCTTTASCGRLVESYSIPLNSSTKDYDRLETYDSLGRPSTTTTSLDTTYVTTYNYDIYGRPFNTVKQRGALSKTFGQIYNQFGYLMDVVRGTGSNEQIVWEAGQQDASNHVIQAGLGNGVWVDRIYNAYTNRLTTGCMDTSANPTCVNTSTEVFQEGYSYDALGNVVTRSDAWNPAQTNPPGVTETFTYDNLNRLSTSVVTGPISQPTQNFYYDAIGDITGKTGAGTGAQGSYSYPVSGSAAIQPHAVSSIAGIGSFSYDADGNMLSGNGRSTSWTSFDMPNTITEGTNFSTFVYGPEHQRIKQTRADITLVYEEGLEVDTNNSTGAVTVKSYWPGGVGFDTDTLDNTGASTANTLTWTHVDRLGSLIGYTTSAGVLEVAPGSLGYDAWGLRRTATGTGPATGFVDPVDNKGFTGQEMLDQLSLVHLNGRVYDPLIGRFMSADPEIQDPTHSQSYNRYTYVWNNPTNDTDPTGFEDKAPAENSHVSFDCASNSSCKVIDLSGALWGGSSGATDKPAGDKPVVTKSPSSNATSNQTQGAALAGTNQSSDATAPTSSGAAGAVIPAPSRCCIDLSNSAYGAAVSPDAKTKENIIQVTLPDGTTYTPMTTVKNSAQAEAFGLSKGASTPIAVPPGADPQGDVDRWSTAKDKGFGAFKSYWADPSHNYKVTNGPMYDAYGNFQFGATGEAAGFPKFVLQTAAQYLHQWNNNPINTKDINSGFNAISGGGTLKAIPYNPPTESSH